MMKSLVTMGAVVLLAGTLAAPVLAQAPPGGRWAGPGQAPCPVYGWAYRATPLTEEQQARINDFRTGYLNETTPLRNEMRAKQVEMRGLMAAETLDEARVRALRKEINDLRAALSDRMTEMQIELRKIDPEARFMGCAGRGAYGQDAWGAGPKTMRRGFKRGYGAGW